MEIVRECKTVLSGHLVAQNEIVSDDARYHNRYRSDHFNRIDDQRNKRGDQEQPDRSRKQCGKYSDQSAGVSAYDLFFLGYPVWYTGSDRGDETGDSGS